jgi:hypothetical protein
MGFNSLVYRQLSTIFMVVITILFTHLWATCCLVCFIPIVKPFWHIDLDYGSYHLPNLEIGLTADVIGQHGMFTPPRHLFSGICVSLILTVDCFIYLNWTLSSTADFPVYQTRRTDFDCRLFGLPNLDTLIFTTDFSVWNGTHLDAYSF